MRVARGPAAAGAATRQAGRFRPLWEGRDTGVLEGDEGWMRLALSEAASAAADGEVPVGAVVVRGGACIGRGHNRRVADTDPTAHAEIVALRGAARAAGGWRLDGATLYVTLEPCPMCAGAAVLARIGRLVFGTADPKAGAAGTLYNVVQDVRLNHRMSVTGGVLGHECALALREFFRGGRA